MNPDHHQIAERIYTENHRMVTKAIARRYRRPVDDPAIQDAISTAIARLLTHLRRGGTIENEPGWLTVVAFREYRRPYSRPEYQRTQPLNDVIENTATADEPTPEQTVIDDAADAGIQRALDRALGRLSPLQRAVITARAEGLTYAAIANRHGIGGSAAEKAVNRARRNLQIDGQLERELKTWRS